MNERPAFGYTLTNLPLESVGATWVERDNQYTIDQSGDATDTAFAAAPQTAIQHEGVQRRAKALAESTPRTRNQRGWEQFDAATREFLTVLDLTTEELPQRVKLLWEKLVALATYIDQDNDLRARPHDAMEPLPPDLRRAFSELLVLAAPFVRGFPTARALDEEAGAFLRQLNLHAPTRAFLIKARDEGLVRTEDADAELAQLAAGERGDGQAHKASARGVASGRNLFSTITRGLGNAP